jgi:pimeloyl-ACP methyl ester carboxylesterase
MAVRGFQVLAAAALAALAAVCLNNGGGALAASGPVSQVGNINGADYKIEIPANWNGDLVLYSHGYVVPGTRNPATDVGDPLTGAFLTSNGYALAGSAYRTTGWSVHEALQDQIALLNFFDRTYGRPKHTIAWGHSLGGMITAALVQRDPRRFTAALPMCGVLAGGVGVWNVGLDAGFVFKTLVAPASTLELVNIGDPQANLSQAEAVLIQAQGTPEGRARIALSAAIGDLPGWFDAASPEPAADDFVTREFNQFNWDSQIDFPFGFAFRAELEGRAGGNPSWNSGVNYREQLARSIDRDEVVALYSAAGLSLEQDLETLEHTRRISADPGAVRYLTRNIVFDGDLGDVPVLTMHTTGDGLVLNQDEQAYASIVDDRQLLRQVFVHRAGHCTFTPAETIAAFEALISRVRSGHWSGLEPADLNTSAASLGSLYNIAPAAFLPFRPTVFPRPFSIDGQDEDRGHGSV